MAAFPSAAMEAAAPCDAWAAAEGVSIAKAALPDPPCTSDMAASTCA
jgi:hypothetical protein